MSRRYGGHADAQVSAALVVMFPSPLCAIWDAGVQTQRITSCRLYAALRELKYNPYNVRIGKVFPRTEYV